MYFNLDFRVTNWSRYYQRVTFSNSFLPPNNVSRPHQLPICRLNRFAPSVCREQRNKIFLVSESLQRLRPSASFPFILVYFFLNRNWNKMKHFTVSENLHSMLEVIVLFFRFKLRSFNGNKIEMDAM